MSDMSTNAVIAALRAISTEISNRELRMQQESLDDEVVEEMGHYIGDLHEALAAVTALYNARRESNPELAPADTLLRSFGW